MIPNVWGAFMVSWGKLKGAIQAAKTAVDSVVATSNSSSVRQEGTREVSAVHILPPVWDEQEVVGESHFAENLRAVLLALGGSGEHMTTALLMPEPDNKFDRRAIAVYVEGRRVGYIPRDETGDFHTLISWARQNGQSTVAFNARVWCENVRAQDLFASVRLVVPTSLAYALPINETPDTNPIWPTGSRLQLSGESDHMAAISGMLSKAKVAGSCSAFVQMRAQLSDKGKWQVIAHFEDDALGMLSASSANKYGPVISRIPAGFCDAYAEVTGNSVAAEVIVYMKAPELLEDVEVKELGLTQ